MAEAATLQIVVTAQDLASAKLKEVQAQTDTMGKGFESTGKNIKAAGSAFLPFSLAAGVGLGLAVKTATDFNQQMLLIQTQAGGSAKEVSSLTGEVLKLAPAVGQSPEALAKALFFIESAGFRGSKAMDVLKLSAEGAAIGQADLTETTRVLTSLMNDHVKGAETATLAMGNLNAIVGAGKMTFNDLNAAMATGIGATAGAFGVSLQSVGAALADLTNKGVPAVDAATHLRMMMLTMELPTASAAKALATMGLTATDAGGRTAAMAAILQKSGVTQTQLAEDLKKPNGISVALTDLRDRLMKAGASSSDASAMIEKSLGGIRAGNTAVILSNDLGGLNDRFAQIGKTSGDFTKSWAAQQETAKQHMDNFKASIGVLMVQLGNSFLPILDKIIKVISDVAGWFGRLPAPVRTIIVVMLAFVAVIGPLLILIGQIVIAIGVLIPVAGALAAAIGAISLPVLIVIGVIAAVIAIGYLLITHWRTVSSVTKEVWGAVVAFLKKAFDDIIKLYKNIITAVVRDVSQWVRDMGHWFMEIPHAVVVALDAAAFAFGYYLRIWKDLVVHWIPDIVRAVVGELGRLPGQVSNIMSAVWSTLTNWLARTWHDAVNFASRIVNDVGNFLSHLPGIVTNIGANLAHAANRAASGVWHGFMDTLNQIPGLIGNMMNNAWHEITGAAEKLASSAHKVASGIWDSFKKGLGIHSPSYIEQAFMAMDRQGSASLNNLKGNISGINSLVPQLAAATSGQLSVQQKFISPTTTGIVPTSSNQVSNSTDNSRQTVTIGTVNLGDASAVQEFFKQLDRDNILVSKGLTPARGT